MAKDVVDLNHSLQESSLSGFLKQVRAQFSGRIVFSTSLGLEDQAITDAIFRNQLDIEVFTLDTGRLFAETYETLQATQQQYGKKIRVYYPSHQIAERFVSEHGINAMYSSVDRRKQCCHIRKLEPLNRALTGAVVWITGLRAEQSGYRAHMQHFEWDEQHHLVKFNPLLYWSLDKLWAYLRQYEVPYNALHNKGFPSIGCAPCTRAIVAGEDERAGRWWWEQDGTKECGLHFKGGKLVRTAA